MARALVHGPKVILADEPTGSLDTVNGELVLEAFVSAARDQGTAVLLVTHEPRVAAWAGREILLWNGHVLGEEAPTPDAVPQPPLGRPIPPLPRTSAAAGSAGDGVPSVPSGWFGAPPPQTPAGGALGGESAQDRPPGWFGGPLPRTLAAGGSASDGVAGRSSAASDGGLPPAASPLGGDGPWAPR